MFTNKLIFYNFEIIFWFLEQNSKFIYLFFWKKISIFGENFDFWQMFWIFANNYIFGQKLVKISILNKLFYFARISSLAKISSFGKIFNFWQKFQFLAKISIFGEHFNFWRKFQFLAQISFFWQKITIL